MRTKIILMLLISFVASYGVARLPVNDTTGLQEKYLKKDLKKIKWIEGKWKGMYKGAPFYEIYKFDNDSTLRITSYEWNGKDSSNSSISFVHWKNATYYLGDELNYKVISISDKEIKMLPNKKAANDILWKYHDDKSWKAILKSRKEVLEYNMEYFDPFRKQ